MPTSNLADGSGNLELVYGPGGAGLRANASTTAVALVDGDPFATSTCTYLWAESFPAGSGTSATGQVVVHSRYSQTTLGESGGLQIRKSGSNYEIIRAQQAGVLTATGCRVDGQLNFMAASVAGNNGRHAIFANGRLAASSTPTTTYTHGTSTIGGGPTSENIRLAGPLYFLAFAPRAVEDALLLQATAAGWGAFEPRRIWAPVSAGGGSYSASLSESTTTTDAATAAYIATASVTESITAADTLAAATTWVRSLTEAATVAESITTAGTFAKSITEAASTADALTSAVTWARALTEAASASDLAAAVIHAVAALTEAASAADSQATGSIYTGSVTEAASAADALTAAATLVALLTEVATTSDAASSAATWVRLLTEPATVVDSVAGAQGATYTASVTEVLAAAELLVAVLAAQGVISAPPLGHGFGMSRRVTQAGRSRPANLNSRTR